MNPNEVNNYCSALNENDEFSIFDNQSLKFDLNCNGTIYGRYLTVQKTGPGLMEIEQLTYFPSPSKFAFLSLCNRQVLRIKSKTKLVFVINNTKGYYKIAIFYLLPNLFVLHSK